MKLTPGEAEKFPIEKNNRQNHYYAARETDAVPLQVELDGRPGPDDDYSERELRGGSSCSARSSCSIAGSARSRRRSRSARSAATA